MRAIVLSRSADVEEIISLLSTLKIEVVAKYFQKKNPHPASYFGPGRIEELLEEVKVVDPDIIVVNDRLKPSQHHFLEMTFQKECVDRTGVILRIFAEHANTPEAVAQVQLARLRYEQPFLREWIHKAKSGERPGFLAGGAYATDVYYEHARTHIRRIEARLDELSKRREVKRRRRHEEGFTLISLAGYTNAGKSALMNALCSAEVEVSSSLFSSLATITRRVKGVKGRVLMVDTVGFIRDLPPDLVDAFKSTLEEVFFADLILLAFDASEDDMTITAKLETSLKILMPRVREGQVVLVGTKIDMIDAERALQVRESVQRLAGNKDVFLTSSENGQGLDSIRDWISRIQDNVFEIDAFLPLTDASFRLLSKLYNIAEVSYTVTDGLLRTSVWCNPSEAEKVRGWLKAAGARFVADEQSREVAALPREAKGPPSD
jgi:GTPase